MKVIIKFIFKKEYIYYFSLFFIVISAFLMIYTYINAESNINFIYPDTLKTEINNYKNQLNNYEDSKCKLFISEYINEVEAGILDTDYDINTAFALVGSTNLMQYYNLGNDNCNISEEDRQRLATNYISILSLMNELFLPYKYQYEIRLDDFYYSEFKNNLTGITYSALKSNEIYLLRKYMDIIEKGNYYE